MAYGCVCSWRDSAQESTENGCSMNRALQHSALNVQPQALMDAWSHWHQNFLDASGVSCNEFVALAFHHHMRRKQVMYRLRRTNAVFRMKRSWWKWRQSTKSSIKLHQIKIKVKNHLVVRLYGAMLYSLDAWVVCAKEQTVQALYATAAQHHWKRTCWNTWCRKYQHDLEMYLYK